MGIACVSVDLDSLPHYCRIHGLPEHALPERAAHLVYRHALGSFLDLFDELEVRGTFFAVGRDLDDPESAAALARAVRAGHEAGNHSWSHDYALTRRDWGGVLDEVRRGAEAVERAAGVRPVGFRAPGYTLTAPLLRAVGECGCTYDSSVFPAAPYWAAKAAVMGVLSVLGRPSRSILDRPLVLAAPSQPYRPDPDEPYRRGSSEVLELPIAVEPLTRVPFIGTSVVALPRAAVSAMYRSLKGEEFLNLELHGIDLLDEDDVGFPPLARVQRDLRIERRVKRQRLRDLVRRICDDFEVMTLADAAVALSKTVG